MALTSSGQIAMSEINTELGRTSTTANTSLEDQSDGTYATINVANPSADRPDGSAPHAMSEFYSYNHSAATQLNWIYSGTTLVSADGAAGGSTQEFDNSGTGFIIDITGSNGPIRCGKENDGTETMDTTMKVALGIGGNPGTGGTGGNPAAGGFQTIFNTSGSFDDNISDLSGNVRVYMSFQAIPHSTKTDTGARYNFYFTNNGVTDNSKDLFAGISRFCFHESVPISTPDGLKMVDDLKVGDMVYTYNFDTNEIEELRAGTIEIVYHDNLYKLNDDIIVTDDHPIYTESNEWVSILPETSFNNYEVKTRELKLGDKLKTIDDSEYVVNSIEKYEGNHRTYVVVTKNWNFYANGILAHSEIDMTQMKVVDSEST